MKIIVWIYRLGGGGAERVMTNLASSFAEAGHDVQVCVHGPDNPYAAELSPKAKLRVLTTSSVIGKLRLRTPFSFFRLLFLVREYKPDVVFTTGAGHGLQLPLLRFFSFIKFLTVLRETNTLSAQKKKSANLLTRVVIHFTPFLYPLNDYVVATSKGIESDLLLSMPELNGKIFRIPNPIDTYTLQALSRETVIEPPLEDKNYILAVGRLVPQKGFDILIHAWAEVYKKFPLKLVILGEGPERLNLINLAKSYGLENNLIMPGFQKNPFTYMARARLFVLSSYHEGLPNVLLQALACECPVVATDCPSGPFEILDGGRIAPLVPVGDSNAMVKGIIDALENGHRYPLSPWKEISAEYDPRKIRDSYISLFSKRKGMNALFPFTGDTIGGSHIATISLINKLKNHGIGSKIVLHQDGPLAEHLRQEGLSFEFLRYGPVRTGSFLPQLYKMARAGWQLSKWIKQNNIQIIHTNDLRMHYTWLLASWIAGKKHIWHQHSHASSPRLWLYMAFPHTILTISNYAASALPAIYKNNTTVVYNDFDIPTVQNRKDCHEALCKELGLATETKIIGFVGNLTEQKRPDFFLNVAKIYMTLPAAPPACFVLIGAPRDEKRYAVEKILNGTELQNRAFYIGPRFPIEPYIAGFDILIAPALREGLGRTPIEAMLFGTPVLASDHGGHKEIIEHGKTGYLFDPVKPEHCAQRLAELLQDSTTATMIAERAQEHAIRKFTGAAYLRKIIDIYGAA